MSASLSKIGVLKTATLRVDLSSFIQRATQDDALIVLGQLHNCRSAISELLKAELHKLLTQGVFTSDQRPTEYLVVCQFGYMDPYYSNQRGQFVAQSAEDVRVHFQEMVDWVLKSSSVSFQIPCTVTSVHTPFLPGIAIGEC